MAGEQALKPLSEMPGPEPSLFEKAFFHGSNDPDFINYTSIEPYLNYAKTYGDMLHYKIKGQDYILLTNPEYLKQIFEDPAFNSRTEVGYIGATYGVAAGYNDGRIFKGLSNDNSAYWKRKRDFVNQFIIPTYPRNLPLFNEYAAKLVEKLKEKGHHKEKFEVETLPILRRWMFELMGEVVIGKEAFNRNPALKEEFYEGISYWLEQFGKFEPFTYPYTNVIARLMAIGLDKRMKHVHDFLADVIQYKRETGWGEDWMSYLAKNTLDGFSLSDDDIKIVSLDLLLGNWGPHCFVLDFGLYELAKFGYVSEKVRAEHDRVIGEDRPLTVADFHKLPYLHGTTMELLRIYPGGGGIGGRLCNTDNTNFRGYRVNNDTGIIYNTLAIHRNEKYYEEPNTLMPTRWAPDAKPMQENTFLTFGYGGKSCPGRDFVVLLSNVVWSYLIRAFDVEYHGEAEPKVIFALCSRTKHDLKHKLVVLKK